MYEYIWQEPAEGWLAHYGYQQRAVDFHNGSNRDFLIRHKQAAAHVMQAGRNGVKEIALYLLHRVADTRTLRCAWDDMRREGGTAPGPNGLSFEDLATHEVYSLLRAIGAAIRNGSYRPGPERECRIPKGSGRGHRVLRIRNIEDRVVERAVVLTIQPLLDPLFDDRSLGYRPARSRFHALALAERLTFAEERFIWITEDLRDAFNHVPLGRLMDLVSSYLPAPALVQLIDRITDTPTRRGLRQGGPLSPLLMNLYLHHHLDRPWRQQCPQVPLVRVADDVLLLCRSTEESHAARAALEQLLLPTGMRLKGSPETTVDDLRHGDTTLWLGFDVSAGNTMLIVDLATAIVEHLEERLSVCHTRPNSALRAVETVAGWIGQLGPTYHVVERTRVIGQVFDIALRQGFQEVPDAVKLEELWCKAHARWCGMRQQLLAPC